MSTRPACLITGDVTDYRVEPFRMLADAERVEVLAFGDARGPARRVSQIEAARLAGSGRYRAVICGLGGRLALPGAYLGARRAGVPFVLWASIWGHPRTPAHALSWLPTLWLYRRADAVATYGPHVSRHVAARRGTEDGVVVAPQAVDGGHFGREVSAEDRERERGGASFLALFVGRLVREKGIEVLLDAWRRADLAAGSVLAIAGEGPLRAAAERAGARTLGRVGRERLPALYSACDVLVLPSIRTATFLEPWGLVCNEAMHQARPVLATDAVGAVAGGLVVDGRNGLVAPAGDPDALATRLRTLAVAPALRARLGQSARRDVGVYTYAAWVKGMQGALRAVRESVDPHAPDPTPGDLPHATS